MIKIFKMNDYDWYAARNADDALHEIAFDSGYQTVEEYQREIDDPPRELSDEELNKLTFVEDDGVDYPNDGTRKSFRQKLNEMIEAGELFPTMFATTEL